MNINDSALPTVSACMSRLQMKSKGLAAICRQLPIVPNDRIGTARIFMEGRLIRMEINPSFWLSMTEDDRTFILAHEAFHVALGHIGRGKGYPQQVMNVAADAVTNDWLMHDLELSISQKLKSEVITMESVGLEAGSALSMEHVMSNLHFATCNKALQMSRWAGEHAPISDGLAENIIQGIMRGMTEEERKDIGWSPFAIDAGKQELRQVSVHAAVEILRMLLAGRSGRRRAVRHTWAREPRRLSDGLLIPDAEESNDASGCHVRFYLDSSGSMGGLEELLFGCTEELERHEVSVSKFWFDTKVHPCEKRRAFGGGGTDFRCIGLHAQESAGFDLAVVVTDGYAPRASVKDPCKWLWLIVDGGSHHAVAHMRWKPFSWAFRRKKT